MDAAKFLMYKIFVKDPPSDVHFCNFFYLFFPSDLKLITMIIFDVDLIKFVYSENYDEMIIINLTLKWMRGKSD